MHPMESGSYWQSCYVSLAGEGGPESVHTILTSPHCTLEAILDSDDVFQELKNYDAMLIHFLTQRSTLQALIHYTIQIPPENSNEVRQFKYPFVSCELLCSDTPSIIDHLMDPDYQDVLDSLWSFIDVPFPTEMTTLTGTERLESIDTSSEHGHCSLSSEDISLDFMRLDNTPAENLLHIHSSKLILTQLVDYSLNNKCPEHVSNEQHPINCSTPPSDPINKHSLNPVSLTPELSSITPIHRPSLNSSNNIQPQSSSDSPKSTHTTNILEIDLHQEHQYFQLSVVETHSSDVNQSIHPSQDTASRIIPHEQIPFKNPVLCGYFSRIISVLFNRCGNKLSTYLRQRPKTIRNLLNRIESRSIAELIKIFLMADSPEKAILNPSKIMIALLFKLTEGYTESQSSEDLGEIQENVSLIIQHILYTQGTDCLFYSIYLKSLASASACQLLMKCLPSLHEPTLVAAVEILSCLCSVTCLAPDTSDEPPELQTTTQLDHQPCPQSIHASSTDGHFKTNQLSPIQLSPVSEFVFERHFNESPDEPETENSLIDFFFDIPQPTISITATQPPNPVEQKFFFDYYLPEDDEEEQELTNHTDKQSNDERICETPALRPSTITEAELYTEDIHIKQKEQTECSNNKSQIVPTERIDYLNTINDHFISVEDTTLHLPIDSKPSDLLSSLTPSNNSLDNQRSDTVSSSIKENDRQLSFFFDKDSPSNSTVKTPIESPETNEVFLTKDDISQLLEVEPSKTEIDETFSELLCQNDTQHDSIPSIIFTDTSHQINQTQFDKKSDIQRDEVYENSFLFLEQPHTLIFNESISEDLPTATDMENISNGLFLEQFIVPHLSQLRSIIDAAAYSFLADKKRRRRRACTQRVGSSNSTTGGNVSQEEYDPETPDCHLSESDHKIVPPITDGLQQLIQIQNVIDSSTSIDAESLNKTENTKIDLCSFKQNVICTVSQSLSSDESISEGVHSTLSGISSNILLDKLETSDICHSKDLIEHDPCSTHSPKQCDTLNDAPIVCTKREVKRRLRRTPTPVPSILDHLAECDQSIMDKLSETTPLKVNSIDQLLNKEDLIDINNSVVYPLINTEVNHTFQQLHLVQPNDCVITNTIKNSTYQNDNPSSVVNESLIETNIKELDRNKDESEDNDLLCQLPDIETSELMPEISPFSIIDKAQSMKHVYLLHETKHTTNPPTIINNTDHLSTEYSIPYEDTSSYNFITRPLSETSEEDPTQPVLPCAENTGLLPYRDTKPQYTLADTITLPNGSRPKVGIACLQILNLVKILLRTTVKLNAAIITKQFLETLVTMFFAHKWNSVLHISITEILQPIVMMQFPISAPSTHWTITKKDSTFPDVVKNLAETALRHLLIDTCFIEETVQFFRQFRKVRFEPEVHYRREKRLRLVFGQQLHVIHLASLLISKQSFLPTDLQDFLNKFDGWNDIVREEVILHQSLLKTPLGGGVPHALLQDVLRQKSVLPLGLGCCPPGVLSISFSEVDNTQPRDEEELSAFPSTDTGLIECSPIVVPPLVQRHQEIKTSNKSRGGRRGRSGKRKIGFSHRLFTDSEGLSNVNNLQSTKEDHSMSTKEEVFQNLFSEDNMEEFIQRFANHLEYSDPLPQTTHETNLLTEMTMDSSSELNRISDLHHIDKQLCTNWANFDMDNLASSIVFPTEGNLSTRLDSDISGFHSTHVIPDESDFTSHLDHSALDSPSVE